MKHINARQDKMKHQKTLEKEIKTSDRYIDALEKEIREIEHEYFDRSDVDQCIEYEVGYQDGIKFALQEYEKRATAGTFARIIYKFVRRNFGESEANDPSWNIELLAKEIANKL